MKTILSILFSMIITCVAFGNVPLAWEHADPASLAGFRVYYGASAGNYTGHVDVSTNLTADINLPAGEYFVVVVAVSPQGIESEYSNEINFTVPSVPVLLVVDGIQIQINP